MKIISLLFTLLFSTTTVAEKKSACYGNTKMGRLEHGVKLPGKGVNFVSYGTLPELSGRTYVHSTVRDIIVEAYKVLEQTHPDKVFKYAETGFKSGGLFWPHKTHQNGLSVDFIVPVVNTAGQSVYLPTSPLNKYGYNIEFDNKGNYKDIKIDFDAMAAHIVTLHKMARKKRVDIWRVIFDPKLQPYLYATSNGSYIKKHIKIPKKRSWVRHDGHYHVDFDIECKR